MSDRYVVIDPNNIVENIILWDGVNDWAPPEGYTALKNASGNIGDTYNPADGTFTPPPLPAP